MEQRADDSDPPLPEPDVDYAIQIRGYDVPYGPYEEDEGHLEVGQTVVRFKLRNHDPERRHHHPQDDKGVHGGRDP